MSNPSSSFLWAVIGAGPAGIAAIGQLLDKRISPADIIWIDPHFNVGDFGSKWSKVSSNTSVNYLTDSIIIVLHLIIKRWRNNLRLMNWMKIPPAY